MITPMDHEKFKVQSIHENSKYDQDLFDKLRAKRKAIADKNKVPPYVVFSDKSLREMAVYYPLNENDFSKLYGVGQSKVEKYASIFIPIIHQYCNDNSIEKKETPKGNITSP